MTAKKRQVLLLALLLVAVVWGIYNFTGDTQKRPPVIPDLPREVDQVRAEKPSESIEVEKYSKLEWGTDPFFWDPGMSDETPSVTIERTWILGGILYRGNNPSAVINRRIVRSGDLIDGATVVQIHKSSVRLEKDGLEFTLTLGKEKS
jgi:hypothetical protein